MLESLKAQVCQANLDLVKHGLVTLTWGNASGICRESGLVVIKASGVPYDTMSPADMAVVNLDGDTIEGGRPSSDTPSHIELYKAWPGIGGIVHTHSTNATIFAQACRGIPCIGTTHADVFYGEIPVTRLISETEVAEAYERCTGRIIVECFEGLDPASIPGVLVAGHGPFTWGATPAKAVEHSVVLEAVAGMALGTRILNPGIRPLPPYIADKHYNRKHGPGAYYGQAPG